jgi:hypothetical protein
MPAHILEVLEQRPPQIGGDVQKFVAGRVMNEGVIPVGMTALRALQEEQEPLGYYLDRFGFELNNTSAEMWPAQALKLSAAVAMLAYQRAGYRHVLDEAALEISTSIAEMEGTPQAYILKGHEDFALMGLMTTVRRKTLEEFPISSGAHYGMHGVLETGAGCVRFHLQNALAAE